MADSNSITCSKNAHIYVSRIRRDLPRTFIRQRAKKNRSLTILDLFSDNDNINFSAKFCLSFLIEALEDKIFCCLEGHCLELATAFCPGKPNDFSYISSKLCDPVHRILSKHCTVFFSDIRFGSHTHTIPYHGSHTIMGGGRISAIIG